jgi:thiamine-phosphate kinase
MRALAKGHPRLLVGIGDDAAVWQAEGRFLLFTIDSLVSGVHFLPGRHPWEDVGWKALAVNISDIMASGGGTRGGGGGSCPAARYAS